jgi:hypothetical protein
VIPTALCIFTLNDVYIIISSNAQWERYGKRKKNTCGKLKKIFFYTVFRRINKIKRHAKFTGVD